MVNLSQDFLSIKEFALLLRMHPNTIRRAIRSGRISAFKIGVGKKAVYRIARTEINKVALFDLEDLIEKIIDKRMNDE